MFPSVKYCNYQVKFQQNPYMQRHKYTTVMLKTNASILAILKSLAIVLLLNPYQETSTFYLQIVAVAKGLYMQQTRFAA